MSGRLLSWLFAALTGVLAVGASGCVEVFPPDAPAGTVLFPITLTLVPPALGETGSRFLLVANSDYDARYRQGSLQSFDLAMVQAAVDACAPADRPCIHGAAVDFVVDEVQVGPHAAGIAVSPRGDRVYLAIRSEGAMTWVDLDQEGRFDCGGNPEAGAIENCAASRRTTPIADDCGRTPELRGAVVAIVAGEVQTLTGNADDDGLDWTMLVHSNGRASLFVDVMNGAERVPTLVHVLEGLATDATNAEYDPYRNLVWMTTGQPPNGSIPIRVARPEVPLIGVAYDRAQPTCSSAFAAGRVTLRGLDTGLDARDVVFSSDGRFAHVITRTPNAFVTIDTEGMPLISSTSLIANVTALAEAPTRAAIGTVDGRELAMATCFGSSVGPPTLDIMDSVTRDAPFSVHGFQGPQDVVIDEARSLAYVVDFRDSVIRVIDLSPIAVGAPPELALQIGTVVPVRTL